MKTTMLWLALSLLVGVLAFALPNNTKPPAPVTAAPVALAVQQPSPVADTNGVPVPKETPYDDRPQAQAYYLYNFCEGYRLAARSTNWGFATQCYFGPMPPPENVLAGEEGWMAGQAAGNASKQLKPRVMQSGTNADGLEILTMQFP